MEWHQQDVGVVIDTLKSSPEGLTSDEARRRLGTWGPNELEEKARRTPIMMFLDQFKDFMIVVLIAAAVVSGLIGDLGDTIPVVVIVLLNAIIGFVQEYRAEKAMATLKKMAAPHAVALRNGVAVTVSSVDIVPGDVVIVEAGNVVPADLRILESAQMKTEEAALTGESVPVEKHAAPIPDGVAALGDRRNMAYKGTSVSYGRGRGLVVATGMKTELGKIATMLQDGDEVKTPLQKRLASFGKRLAIAVLAICAIVFAVGIARGEAPVLMLLTAISLAIAAIPEALPAVVTIALAFGAKKMVKQNALIRRLPAVETLGSVTYICSDKTGTLTQNTMTVEELYVDGTFVNAAGTPGGERPAEAPLLTPCSLLMTALALNNDVHEDASGQVMGDPTEIAPYTAARNAGFHGVRLAKRFPRVLEIPFDSERKCMTTFHKVAKDEGVGFEYVSFTKGAPDVLVGRSQDLVTSAGVVRFDADAMARVNETMASRGNRVLAVAMRQWRSLPTDVSPGVVESGLTFVGLVGIMDPPKEEAKEAVRLCKSAGIVPVLITGDHPSTARAIAIRLGIMEEHREAIITGKELDALSLEQFASRVEHIQVYARVAPEQKLRIVRALQQQGHFVAMTGDGVNDAPALKSADIGVAMGVAGTDVSREAGHMILLDDNFATIVKAVKEGRRIFDNIRKFIKYTMTSNSGEIWSIFLAPFLGLPIPLLPIHILWINLVTDGLPGLALSAEPAEKGIMNRLPRHPKESIFANGMATHMVWVGLLMGFATLSTQAWSIKTGHAHWQTMVFTVLCLSQMGHVLAIRSETESIFTQGLLSNKPLLGAFALTLALQMATIYVPFLQPVFRTQALTVSELMFTLGMSSVVFIAVEVEKLIKRRCAHAETSGTHYAPGVAP